MSKEVINKLLELDIPETLKTFLVKDENLYVESSTNVNPEVIFKIYEIRFFATPNTDFGNRRKKQIGDLLENLRQVFGESINLVHLERNKNQYVVFFNDQQFLGMIDISY